MPVYGFFIGRFQPFHLGHMHAIHHILASVDRLWVGIGSSNRSGVPQNPFTASERRAMIMSSLDADTLGRMRIFEIPDAGNHDQWVAAVSATIPHFDVVFTNDATTRHIYAHLGIMVKPIPFEDRQRLSGTEIRRRICSGESVLDCIPEGTRRTLLDIGATARLRGM